MALELPGSLCGGTGRMCPLARPAPSALQGWQAGASRPLARQALQVNNAISRKTKAERLSKLEAALQASTMAFGVRYEGVKVVDFEAFRRSLPAGASLIVSKNTLLRVAADRVGGWGGLHEGIERENAWVFASEEAVAASVKAYLAFEKKLLEPIAPKDRLTAKPTDVTGAVLEGETLNKAALYQLEKMPTKAELMQKLAIMIKKIPTRVAVVIKAIPQKVAIGVNQLALAAEAEGGDKLVADVSPRAGGAAPEAA